MSMTPEPAEEQLRRMRAAFHINMLRAFPGKTHAEIEAEIDKACGTAPQAASQQAEPGIHGPLTDVQRDECRTLYNNLKHLQSGGYYVADDVIRQAAGYGYMNGYRDFAPQAATHTAAQAATSKD